MASETLDIIIKARNDASRTLSSTQTMFDGLKKAAAGIGITFSAALAGRAAVELVQLGASAQRVEGSFRQLAGSGADEMLERLRVAARGTVADTELMLSANKAMMLGVSDSSDTLARLLEVAAERGKALGLSTTQAFGDIVTGIGRLSPLILDNLGIVTGGAAVYDDYARSIGKAAEQLSDFERRQALVQLVLDQSAGGAGAASMAGIADTQTGIEQLRAAWANLKTEVGAGLSNELASSGLVAWIPKAISDVAGFVSVSNQVDKTLDAWVERLYAFQQAGGISYGAMLKLTTQSSLLGYQVEYGSMSMNRMQVELAKLEREAGLYNAAANEAAYATLLASEAMAGMGMDAGAAVGGVNALTRSLYTLIEASAAMGAYQVGAPVRQGWQAQNYADQIREQLAARQAAKEAEWDYNYALADESGQLSLLQEKLQGVQEGTEDWYRIKTQMASLDRSTRGGAAGGGGGISDAEQQAREMATRVQGAIDAVFAPSQVTERDWWETHLGLYEDKPDEFLRRLRSAANEADSEWKHLLGGRTGESAQLYLAQQEELWRTGQWSQMGAGFDPTAAREAIVQQALARLQAESSREAMIAEIMNDPRLGGFSMAQREQVLGVGSESGGATYAEAWVTGAVSVDAGKEFTDAFSAQLEGQEARWRVFGSLSAGWMIDGMGDAAALASNALVDVLFPGIMDELRRAGVVATP